MQICLEAYRNNDVERNERCPCPGIHGRDNEPSNKFVRSEYLLVKLERRANSGELTSALQSAEQIEGPPT
jgi:hypothetical protein